jgi:hypothetical protein
MIYLFYNKRKNRNFDDKNKLIRKISRKNLVIRRKVEIS